MMTKMTEKTTVLLVEDHPGTQIAVKRALLHLFDYVVEVTVVDNATDAIALLRSIKFDVIVSDLILGATNGGQVLSYLRADQPEMLQRFVFFTSSTEEARALHDKVISKDDATTFAGELARMMKGVVPPESFPI